MRERSMHFNQKTILQSNIRGNERPLTFNGQQWTTGVVYMRILWPSIVFIACRTCPRFALPPLR